MTGKWRISFCMYPLSRCHKRHKATYGITKKITDESERFPFRTNSFCYAFVFSPVPYFSGLSPRLLGPWMQSDAESWQRHNQCTSGSKQTNFQLQRPNGGYEQHKVHKIQGLGPPLPGMRLLEMKPAYSRPINLNETEIGIYSWKSCPAQRDFLIRTCGRSTIECELHIPTLLSPSLLFAF